jgi:hypothetical protein
MIIINLSRKSEDRSPKFKVKRKRLLVHDTRHKEENEEVGRPKSEDRRLKTEVGSQKSEDRSRKSGSRKTEVRSPKSKEKDSGLTTQDCRKNMCKIFPQSEIFSNIKYLFGCSPVN